MTPAAPDKSSLRKSPSRLRKEIEELKKNAAKDEGKVKEIEANYNRFKALEGINPASAQAAVETLTRLNHANTSLGWHRNRLSELKKQLSKAQEDAELRAQGLLCLSVFSNLIDFSSFALGLRAKQTDTRRSRQCMCLRYKQISTYERLARWAKSATVAKPAGFW
jgi:hypothetical protein